MNFVTPGFIPVQSENPNKSAVGTSNFLFEIGHAYGILPGRCLNPQVETCGNNINHAYGI